MTSLLAGGQIVYPKSHENYETWERYAAPAILANFVLLWRVRFSHARLDNPLICQYHS